MGVITASAVIAATTVAISAATAAKSFSDASKAKQKVQAATAEAKNKMSDARKKLETNFADVLSINKEPYERQREAMLAAGSQALEAGVESERGGAATAGRVLAGQQEGQGLIRDAQSDALFDLEAMQAEEDSRLRDIGVQIDLGEVAGAQQAAAAAEEAAVQHKNAGLQAAGQAVAAAGSAAPLFAKTGGAKQANKINTNSSFGETQGGIASLSATDQVTTNKMEGTAAIPAVPEIGIRNKPGYQAGVTGVEASPNYKPATNIYDGVDITPIQGDNVTQQQFDAFMSKQSGKWARGFRKSGLGINTRMGELLGFNPLTPRR